MVRAIVVFVLTALVTLAADFRLYLKDGSYQLVREYHVEGERVRFYTVERSDWEEIPLSLIDLKRTEDERRERQEAIQKQATEIAAEDKYERQQRDLRERIPVETGVYFLEGSQVRAIKQAETKAVNNKGRSVLKHLSPIPMIAGKSTIELEGEHSANVMSSCRPEFYFRIEREESFGIVKMMPKKGVRVVQVWEIVPVANEVSEKEQDVKIFRKQIDDGLYEIWPEEPLEPGEYAVIEYSPGERNVQTWDFACKVAK